MLIALGFPPKNVPAVVRYTLNGEVLEGLVEPGCRWFAQEVKDDHAGIEIVGVSVGGFANPVAGEKFSLGSAGKNQRVLEIPERQVFYPPACIEDGIIHASISGDENLPAASGSLFSHALFDEDVEFASIFDGLGEHAKARKKVKSPKVNLWLVDHNS